MMKYFFTPLLFVNLLYCQAQQDYVITIQTDTIYGEVTLLLPDDRTEPVKIETLEGTRQLNSHQIRAARIDGENYKTIKFGEKYHIMQEVISGYLGLYTYRPEKNYEFGSQYLYKATNEGLEVSALFFRNSISKFLADCEKIATAINDKKYGFNDVEALVRDYNRTCINDASSPQEKPGTSNPGKKPSDNGLKELEEFNTLIADILRKINHEEPVPDYMKNALKSYSEKDLNTMIDSLLDTLDEE